MTNYLGNILLMCFISCTVVCAIAFVLFIPYALYKVATAETFSLVKANWVCSRKVLRNTVNSVVASNGSVVVVPSTEVVCVQYTLKSEE